MQTNIENPEIGFSTSVVLLNNPTQEQSHLPRLFGNGKDLYMSWVTRKEKTDYLNYAVYKGGNWIGPETITQGDDWFTNWADFPVISEHNGTILTTYLQKSDTATYAYDIRYNIYNPRTKTWQKNVLLNTDGTHTEHGFVSAVPVASGFEIAWLDGRNTAGGYNAHDNHGAGGSMTLRSAIIGDSGEILNQTELDNRVCDCCQTSIANNGSVTMIAYRDRSDTEVRDISIVRKEITGHLDKSIETVHADNWKIAGCPVNGPAIDAFENTFGVAWFTAANGEGEVYVSLLGNQDIDPVRVDNGNATGRVDFDMLSAHTALVLWMEPKGENEVIMIASVDSKQGKTGEILISEISPDRASGFPQLEVIGNFAYIAWTEIVNGKNSIKTAFFSTTDLH
ncbi:MAG: hypothetical protein CMC70_05895 [Flavobacteriaceae bacterium]|nr:hypothetical protein [Flavobacteriaceae bacterium]